MHYWMPVIEKRGVRHAFRGRRWEGQPRDESVCGLNVPMAKPSQMDWITFPTCTTCWKILADEAQEETGPQYRVNIVTTE